MGFTFPWQLVAAHESGPMYLTGSFTCAVSKQGAKTDRQTKSRRRKKIVALRIRCAGRICSLISFAARRSQRMLLSAFSPSTASQSGDSRVRGHELPSQRRGPNGLLVNLECGNCHRPIAADADLTYSDPKYRSEEHTSELQSRVDLVCRLLLEK